MSGSIVAPYGSWRSPITAGRAAAGSILLYEVVLDGDDVYWTELRPEEGGRYALLRRAPDGGIHEVTPASFNVRTRVHEYGGGAYTVVEGTVYFINFADQRLYVQPPGEAPRPLTGSTNQRHADFIVDSLRGWLVCVQEDHSVEGQEAVNCLVRIDPATGDSRVIVSGSDFYAAPRLSPDGFRLAWLSWNHPDMPWDGAELWVADLMEDGAINQFELVAGGDGESIFQPEWSPDGTLHFASDRTGWWNLYHWRGGNVEAVLKMEADLGRPQWQFGYRSYAFVSSESLICTYTRQGFWYLASLDIVTGELEEIATPYRYINYLQADPNRAVFIAGAPKEPMTLVAYDLVEERIDVLHRPGGDEIAPAYLSDPRPVAYPTTNGQTAYGLYYPPRNPDFAAPPGEYPPLVVFVHGGPTSAARTYRQLEIHYWTSRGFGLLDVNYGGSTGYGRPYRERLNGEWGVVDVEDSANGARFLAEQGLVDGKRLAIRGGSAGGFTTLCALTFRDDFLTGTSYYGVSDLAALAQDTHKFESRYLDRLVGPYPEMEALYQERSPIHHVDRLSRPVLILQGTEDQVVPTNQAEMIYQAVKAKGLPVAYLLFEGEQHGFRRAESIRRALEAELYFYGRMFGFEPADDLPTIEIENL